MESIEKSKKEVNIITMNVPNLIRTNQYFQYMSLIKNYEDTIHKLFMSGTTNNSVINDPLVFLWKITEDDNDLFNNISNIDLKSFPILDELFNDNEDIMNKIVITGPYIRGHLVGMSNNIDQTVEIRKEIYLYRLCDSSWNELIDTTEFADKKSEMIYDNGDIKVCLVKKQYKSPAHVILQYSYLKRIGYFNNAYYVSSMFLLEIQKHSNLLVLDFKDPILGIPYDPLEIYQFYKKDKSHPIKIIEMADYEKLTQLSKKNFTKLFNSKTCLEICLDRYVKEDHPIIANQLKQMIIFLCSFTYKRPPHCYAKILGIDKNFPDIYDLLKCVKNEYDINNIDNIESLDEINDNIIKCIILTDNLEHLLDFLDYTKQKIGKTIVDYIIKYNNLSVDISSYFITNKSIDTFLIYYMILMTENLELIKLLSSFEMDLAINYLEDILLNGKLRSFYFLYDTDSSIINTIFESGRNVLHKINMNIKYESNDDLLNLVIKLKPELMNMIDNNKETPVIYHSKNNPQLLKVYLDYAFDSTISDDDGNIFLHHLCKNNSSNDYSTILKMVLKKYPELIDMPNKKSETPAIICCQNGNENMFYTIKGMGADLNTKDCYGNTVYHYICATSMCIGMMIYNNKNYFGLTPQDYCKISSTYYNFIDQE